MFILFGFLALLTSGSADSTITSEQLDKTNILEASRILGTDIANNLATGVTNSLPYVQKILSSRPSPEECQYVAIRDIQGVDDKMQRLVTCLLAGVSLEDSDNNEQKIKKKITSAAIDIVATIPEDDQCAIDELQNVTLEMGINHPVYLECVLKFIFRNIATLGE